MVSNYRIFCAGELIGTSTLGHRDPAMAVASGVFVPAPGYEKVRAIFRLFSDAQRDTGPADENLLDAYYRARDALALSVETETGQLLPTNVVHIVDLSTELGDDAYEVEVHVASSDFLSPQKPVPG